MLIAHFPNTCEVIQELRFIIAIISFQFIYPFLLFIQLFEFSFIS